MAPLPLQVPQRHIDNPRVVSAYDVCLTLERSLQRDIDAGKVKEAGNDLTYVRILGYLIHHVPTDRGLQTVVEEIDSHKDDSSPLSIGRMYYNHYIRAFRSNKGHTPIPSNHASRPSFDTIADMVNDTLEEASRDHSDAKKKALYRDGYRCVVTGKYDERSVAEIRELTDRMIADPSLRTEATKCAHIFNESTNFSIEPGSSKRDYAPTMWAVMRRFGYEELPDDLNGDLVHRLENVMTLVLPFHASFDRLKVWFVATGEPNKYKLEATMDYILRDYPKYVTFTTPDQVKFPVPSPTYLAIHAACAKVAHLSGAAECIDRFYRDMEDRKILDPNGSSANTLEHALFKLQTSGYEITA